jgi:N-methylhydantoinase A
MVMLAYGGNGPAFAAIQAEDLGIDKVLVPKASPTFSALGTLVADPSIDEERSCIAPADNIDTAKLTGAVDGAGRARRGVLRRRQFPGRFGSGQIPAQHALSRTELGAQLRPSRSTGAWTTCPSSIGRSGRGPSPLFNDRHMQEYGHIREDETPEITGVRLATSVATPSPVAAKGFAAPLVPARAPGRVAPTWGRATVKPLFSAGRSWRRATR